MLKDKIEKKYQFKKKCQSKKKKEAIKRTEIKFDRKKTLRMMKL
jgi:hypothetical protein